MSRGLRYLPLLVLALVVGAMVWRLAIPGTTAVESKLEGQEIPTFDLAPALPGKPGLSSASLADGRAHLVNIFASWCVPCATEVAVLGKLKERGVRIEGVAVRDRPEDVARFLARFGDPYAAIGSDPQSRMQIALGSSGVPESFVVDGRGIIRYQHIGPIGDDEVPAILALLERAK